MDLISSDVALSFCKLCNWTYETWVTHKMLFDQNKTPEQNIEKAIPFTNRLSVITHEYCLLQIAKLHDPAVQGNSRNLTIKYIVRFGHWGPQEERIQRLWSQLRDLWERLKIKAVRNKNLSHNDLEALASDAPLGGFPEGTDNEYMTALQDLVNEVHEKWFRGPYPFNDLAVLDVKEFLAVLARA